MLPGPVFTFELLTTARRGRFYLVRATYAIILLSILWLIHSVWEAEAGGELASYLVNWFAFSAFCGVAIGQGVLVLVLTPTLVAGSIADEKRRKTLHYLLASRLTSAEIVVGKLLLRMLYVTVLPGVSLPVLSLLVLFGGIDPSLVVLACAGTFSTAWFLAALSTWVSTIARQPREALFVTYGLELMWLFAAPILRTVPTSGWPAVDGALFWLREWLGASSPIDVGWRLLFGFMTGGRGRSLDVEAVLWMVRLQLAFGLVLTALSAWQLRPIFRRQAGQAEAEAGKGRLRSLLSFRWPRRFRRRPALADRPMLWKELHTGGSRGFARFMGVMLTLIGGGWLAFETVSYAADAIGESREYAQMPASGPSAASWQRMQKRDAFAFYLGFVVPLVYVIGTLAVAGAAAAAVTSEREDDTWVSLAATTLTGREILVAKQLGALRRGRKFVAVIVLLAAVGVVAGSVHVLAIPALITALVVYGWFAAAFGVWISLWLRSTWRAQFLTIAGLLLVSGSGQVLLNLLAGFGIAPQVWPGFTPADVGKLLFRPGFVESLGSASWRAALRSGIDDGMAWRAILSITSVLGYAALAALFTWHAAARFEVAAGRAHRSRVLS
jgi:ABC-type transport system involved in multi-copper enzyme maturation permease subunit